MVKYRRATLGILFASAQPCPVCNQPSAKSITHLCHSVPTGAYAVTHLCQCVPPSAGLPPAVAREPTPVRRQRTTLHVTNQHPGPALRCSRFHAFQLERRALSPRIPTIST